MKLSVMSSVIALALVATPAVARTVPIIFTGTVRTGYDGRGAFGIPGATLDGLPYVQVFTIDDLIPPESDVQTATSRDYPGPLIASMDITINGITQHITGARNSGLTLGTLASGTSNIYASSWTYVGGVQDDYSNASVSSTTDSFINSLDFHMPLFHRISSADNASGYFRLSFFNAGADFNPESVRIGAVAAVPEPATWGMMLAGFGLIGVTMRRRRKSIATSQLKARC